MSSAPLPSSFDGTDFFEESRWQKFSRRLKEEPLVPLGCMLTCWALVSASRSIRAGDHNRTNQMFRARIYAQGFTIAAIVAGSMYWQTDHSKRKEFEKLVEERKAKEKNARWIAELEARDLEAKEEMVRRGERKGRKISVVPPVRENEKFSRDGLGADSTFTYTEEEPPDEKKTGILQRAQNLILGGKK